MKKVIYKISRIILLVVILLFSFSCKEDKNEYFDWKAVNEDWLKQHQNDSGFVATETGLFYKVIRRGNPSDRQPNPTSSIQATYKGKLIDGTVFSEGKEVYMGKLYELIKGVQEALLMMHTGDIYELYIPYDIAYGKQGFMGRVPPYSTLYFEIELIDSGL